MNYQFNQSQFDADVQSVKDFWAGFIKSFLPGPKSIQGRELGFFEESYIRFRLHLVDMGISKLIRTVIFTVVILFLLITLFPKLGSDLKILFVIAVIVYYAWLFTPHFTKDGKPDGKPVDTVSGWMLELNKFRTGLFEKKEEKKK
jgi:hypothetical protein